MAGKGGGAWKVAYADFVTAMMAFFMVMWLVGQNAETKEAVQEYFQNPTVQLLPAWVSRGPHEGGGSPRKPQSKVPGPDDTEEQDKRQRRIRSDNVQHARIVVRSDGDRAFAGTIVIFSDDSATLDETAQAGLTELVPLLAGKTNRIEVRGHTARRALADAQDPVAEWQLSFARSMAVLKFLEGAGIEAQRMRLSQACSFEPPSKQQDGQPGPQARVEVYLLSEFIDGPADDEHGVSHVSTTHDHGAAETHAADDEHHELEATPVPVPKPNANRTVKKPAPPPKKAPAKSGHGGGHGGGGHGKPAAKKPAKSSHGGHH